MHISTPGLFLQNSQSVSFSTTHWDCYWSLVCESILRQRFLQVIEEKLRSLISNHFLWRLLLLVLNVYWMQKEVKMTQILRLWNICLQSLFCMKSAEHYWCIKTHSEREKINKLVLKAVKNLRDKLPYLNNSSNKINAAFYIVLFKGKCCNMRQNHTILTKLCNNNIFQALLIVTSVGSCWLFIKDMSRKHVSASWIFILWPDQKVQTEREQAGVLVTKTSQEGRRRHM